MSDRKQEPPPSESSGEPPSASSPASEDELSSMVRGALQENKPSPDILGEVQRRLREESEGRFYSDGWSVEREPPIRTFLITSLGMMMTAVAIYALVAVPASQPRRVQLAQDVTGQPD